MKKRLCAVVSAVMLILSVPLPVSAETAENEDNNIMTVSVVDYDTGETILTDTDQVWGITLQGAISGDSDLSDGMFSYWEDIESWSYGSNNPHYIDMSAYMYYDDYRVDVEYIPYGYFLPEDYLELHYKESDEYHTVFPSDITVKLKKTTMGDVNDDGAFNVSDVVLLQKWLLAVPDTHLANWRAADFCEDNVLNVFDLCLMKRELIDQLPKQELYLATLTTTYGGYGVDGRDLGSGEYTENFTVKKGDVFYETMDGHWIRENESGTSDILRINDINSTSVSLTYSHWGEMTDIVIPLGGNLDVDSIFQEMDGINYSYNISFSDNNDVATEKYITGLDYTIVGRSDAITSTAEFENYLNQFERRNDNTIGQNFDNITEKYDEEFFRSNVLLLKPILGTSTASHFSINKAFYKGNKLIIDYVDHVEEEGCDIVIGYLGVVAVPKTDFHADSVEWRLTSYYDFIGIKSGYIAVFTGEDTSHSIKHYTYIYKIDNGAGNYGFDYINTSINTKTGGEYKWGQGSVMWTDDVFPVAQANKAYDYVMIPGDDTKYTIEEFMERFLMD